MSSLPFASCALSSPGSGSAGAFVGQQVKIPSVWLAGELGSSDQLAIDTGYELLNKVLPGGGWPQGALVELIQPQPGQLEWGLVAPALVHMRAVQPSPSAGITVLVGPPHLPFGPALAARFVAMQHMLHVKALQNDLPGLLWATREALQCADVAAVLAWLPQAHSSHLRRLQIAAHAHNKLLFVFRPLRAQHESSPACLRLMLEGSLSEGGNLQVHVLKRRGPPLAAPVLLATRPERLEALLKASLERVRRKREEREQALPAPAVLMRSINDVPKDVLQDAPKDLQHLKWNYSTSSSVSSDSLRA